MTTNMYGVTPLQPLPPTEPTQDTTPKPEGHYAEQAKDLPPAIPNIATPRELLAPMDSRFFVYEDEISPSPVLQIPVDISETLPTDVDMLKPRIDRLTPAVQREFEGSTFDPRSTETSDILDGRGAGAYGFAESTDEILRLYEGIHGEGRVRVFEDDQAGIFEPQFYVSLQKDDGSFTPFASPLQDTYDVGKAVLSNVAFEVPVGSASVATAWAAAGTATFLSSPIPLLAPIVGGLTFAYTLYAMGGSGEKFKQEVLKDELNLTEAEADEVGTLIERAYDVYNEGVTPTMFGGEEFTAGEAVAGYTEMLVGIPGALMDKFRLAMGRVRRKYLSDMEAGDSPKGVYQSAISAQVFAGNIGLPGFTLAQVKNDKIIERLDSLSQQTSLVIPDAVRGQIEAASKYLKEYGDDIGEGNFAQFQDNLDDFTDYYASIRQRLDTPDYEKIGTSMQEIDSIFRQLRYIEAKGMYDNVFDAVGKRSYNLSTIDAVISKRTRPVIPEKPSPDAPYEATQAAYGRGEANVYDTIEILKTIGNEKDGGVGVLTNIGLDNAIKAFNKANPRYAIDKNDPAYSVDSPAKLLQMFATRFGEMASDLRNIPQEQSTVAIKNATTTAMEMRNALLDLIGNPEGASDALKSQIQNDLKQANDFYKETYEIVDDAGIKFKTSVGGPAATEPGFLSKEILLKTEGDAQEKLLKALNKQTNYIKTKLSDVEEGPQLDLLREAFAQRIEVELARTIGAGAAEESGATSLMAFLKNFSTSERTSLGYPPERIQEIMAEADMLAEMASDNWATTSMRYSVPSTPMRSMVKNIFASDTGANNALAKAIRVVKQDTAGTGLENLRRGIFDYIVSTESGVLKEVTQNSGIRRAGTQGKPNFYIDPQGLAKLLTQMNESMPELRNVLTPQDIEVLEGLSVYVNTIAKADADAGSALAGAQIIGELFTIDGYKFLSGLARLSAQNRVGELFTNDLFVKAALGIGKSTKDGTFKDTLRTYFMGKGAMGAIVADMSYDPATEEEQMRQNFDDRTVDAPMGMYNLEAALPN